MLSWIASSTLLIFTPPLESARVWTQEQTTIFRNVARVIPNSVAAVNDSGVIDLKEFESIWTAFFGKSATDLGCGSPLNLYGSDSDLIKEDIFVVRERGFHTELCNSSKWFVASARIDPCRIRIENENRTYVDIFRCSKNGKFNEIRFVLQPVLQHDRGPFFPDTALHISFTIKNSKKVLSFWKEMSDRTSGKIERDFFKVIRNNTSFNDASLFISGSGLERWTFLRVVFDGGTWRKDRLAHGGFHESLSDVDLNSRSFRTPVTKQSAHFSPNDFLNPMKTNPLSVSCVSCHLAQGDRPARMFRQLGWGLFGEGVVSRRVIEESHFAARELKVLGRREGRK